MVVYTDNGVKIELVEPPLGKGGEGAVYKMKGFDRVAKIYTADPESHRAKIEAMCSMAGEIESDPALKRVAWPLGALYLDPSRTRFAGFGMRQLQWSMSFADLEEFPAPARCDLTLSQKVDALIEMADIVNTLHRHNQVVGDLNDDNLVLCKDGHVGLVDADSFHATVGRTTYPCVACMPGFMAPELIRATNGKTFSEVTGPTFTNDTDDFAVAVHVFKTLMNGVHPFHSTAIPKPSGSVPAAVSIDKRVLAGQSPYFSVVPGFQAPQFAPSLDQLGTTLVPSLQQAFGEGQVSPDRRPDAGVWRDTLKRYKRQLAHCANDPNHYYDSRLKACPYCAAEAAVAVAPKTQTVTPKPQAKRKSAPKAAPAMPPITAKGVAKGFVFWVFSLGGLLAMWFAFMSYMTGTFLDFEAFAGVVTWHEILPAAVATGVVALFNIDEYPDRSFVQLIASWIFAAAGILITALVMATVSVVGEVVWPGIVDAFGWVVQNWESILLFIGSLVGIYVFLKYWETIVTVAICLSVLALILYLVGLALGIA